MRLRRVSPTSPGLQRHRHGKGFRYTDAGGQPVSAETRERIEALVIPPAWEDVWICPVGSGHIQATGVDVAGRRQYRYHDHWRLTRDLEKHERVLDVAAVLPKLRERVSEDLQTQGLCRERVLSGAVRLLDLGFFRIGSEQYASKNQSYGLATMLKEHVTVSRHGVVTFDYTAKSGKHRVQSVVEPEVADVVQALKRRRGGGEQLLAYRDGTRWVPVRSGDINAHLQALTGTDITAKDFRTWSATVLAAVGLAMSTGAESVTARKRAVTRVVQEVSHYLGNTPAVCRASYIDPRVIDLYDQGVTIRTDVKLLGDGVEPGHPATQGRVEAAVLRLLRASHEAAEAG
jgi:DNA topoisomerase-1